MADNCPATDLCTDAIQSIPAVADHSIMQVRVEEVWDESGKVSRPYLEELRALVPSEFQDDFVDDMIGVIADLERKQASREEIAKCLQREIEDANGFDDSEPVRIALE